ncbi:hypothetical protein P344_00720 [Spiroplasma mirum ATCC 29335]|uniref:UPF0122 protein P344_00720 n=1 Tax=Spiroplasma mirum ATCC 29335 TaxID=838561 RepID=W0GPN9_9MOLU|nr:MULTISPECIES: DNA-binding protein [Spiroplasma]AHF60584.1 hypothetical protein SMM_0117 [Spiroplasma mirum ATCC 29335]AHI57517.1 hypothetical protein P344_00720 [Spiroplasma mirum ATCC 29335]AKM52703.1 hypothetical protein SATRI_v1c01240 [Spiroplasma atrichopogonis]
MKDLERTNYLIDLYEIYSSLLTPKQITYFKLYFFEDYSLSEISEMQVVSRNAVYDSLLKISKTLIKFENSLKICYKQTQRENLYQKYYDTKECQELINKLKKIEED